MIIQYLFASPEGDIPLTPDKISTPFKMTLIEDHPFLTLGDYFENIRDFLLEDIGPLMALLREQLNRTIVFEDIKRLLIRSEKHGALYHLASAEIFIAGQSVKYAVSSAVSEKGRAWLHHEYNLLRYLRALYNLNFLPEVYFIKEMNLQSGTRKASISMFLGDWFEDYHEWHLSLDPRDRSQKIRIWDQKRGHRFASREEQFEIYQQAARILSLYYDTREFRQIHPWHHAAGDFVVKCSARTMNVKLTTARGYKPFINPLKDEKIDPFIAITYFLLNLTIKMRLDRRDGTGEMAWAADDSVEATIGGFMEAIKMMEMGKRFDMGTVKDLLSLLKSFNRGELYKLHKPLLEFFRDEAPMDFSVITKNLNDHINKVYQVIQRFHE